MDFTENFQSIEKQLIGYKTNIVFCELKILLKLNAENERVKILFMLTIFGTNCVLIQVERLQCNTINFPRNGGGNDFDKNKSSKILFYAKTSGTCGEVKPVGVTYKCFMPNITSLG